jgi:hypothetical protein
MRMERQATDGEVLPNARSRVLHPRSIINVALEDDAHITLWIRGTRTPLAPPLANAPSAAAGSALLPCARHR